MPVRKVTQVGNPSLKKQNKVIEDFSSKIVKQLIIDLKDTLYKTGLVGIAAPQIAKNYMVFVTHARNTTARTLAKSDIFRVYINPRIVKVSKETSFMYEGCGSIVSGGLFGSVQRPKEVTVEAFDESGKKFSLTCDGLLARIIQHECDHLQGVTFMEKVSDYSGIVTKTYYRKNIRESKAQKEACEITKLLLI